MESDYSIITILKSVILLIATQYKVLQYIGYNPMLTPRVHAGVVTSR